MNFRLKRQLGTLILAPTLAMTMWSGFASAQAIAAQEIKVPPKPPVPASPQIPDPNLANLLLNAANSDARGVRDQLQGMFQNYPPSLQQVLRLDPSLLTNQEFMKLYPGLAAFIGQHPEIVHNAAFFVGSPNYNYNDFRNSRVDDFGRIIEPFVIGSVFVVLICTLGWIIRGIINHRRWMRMSKLQTDTQTKLLERFSSNEELLTFIQTSAGKRFLESASIPAEIGPRSVSAPLGRMLWSVQLGIVMLVTGAGMEMVGYRLTDPDAVTGFQVAGVLVIALGVGFILSAVGSYILSRRLGLFDPASTSTS